MHRFFCVFLIATLNLSACEPAPKKHSNRELLAKTDKPISFRARTLGYIKRSNELSKYICDALEFQLQDRILVHKTYSAEFITSVLSELPESLRRVYGSCYVENELKEESLVDYFKINQGFLGEEAIQAYEVMDAKPQAKILRKAFELALKKSKNPQEQQQVAAELKKLDKAWAKLDWNLLKNQRGDYSRMMLSEKAWPTNNR